MFRKHPKGLLPVIMVNMFVRFAFYALISVLILFLSERSELISEKTSIIYSIFYVVIFILTFVGGFVADKTRDYKGTILKGLVLMAIGYVVITIATISGQSWVFLTTISTALLLIALGNGLFRGNMQAMLGQMYDDQNYSQMRDSGFLLSNLFLNIGALFAPMVALGIRNSCISHNTGFFLTFILAAVVMVTSLVIFLRNEKKFPTPAKLDFQTSKIDAKIMKQRVYALLAVFGVLNLFYIAFHQDGLVLTSFAKDYIELQHWRDWKVDDFSKISTLFVILAVPIVLAIFSALRAKGREPSTLKKMGIGMGIAAIAYLVMILGSVGLPIIPFLFGTYLILAIAELLVYPLLSSFISQFARPKHQGIMQSVCVLATVIGNSLLFLGMIIYEHTPIWATWLILATICLISMIALLSMLKWIEKTMKNVA